MEDTPRIPPWISIAIATTDNQHSHVVYDKIAFSANFSFFRGHCTVFALPFKANDEWWISWLWLLFNDESWEKRNSIYSKTHF